MTTPLTKEEHAAMADLRDEFWREFSALCRRFIDRAPPGRGEYLKMMLGEATSIYGIKKEK